MSLFTNEEFGHLAIRLNECRCPTCKRIAEKICDDHKGINPYEQRIKDVIDILNEQQGCSKLIAEDGDYEKAWDLLDEEVKKVIILLCNGVKQ